MGLECPRDRTTLERKRQRDFDIDHCGACGGDWYDYAELAMLEAQAADEDTRAGTVEYSKRESTLNCPACGKSMVAFDYRAHALELDACPDEHGFWLDSGESTRVMEIMQERKGDLSRSASAQRAWNRSRERGFSGGVFDRLRYLFGGRR